MRERPIIFSGEMVRALLENRKTQTRRVVKPQLPDEPTRVSDKRWGLLDSDFYYCGVRCPYGRPGDSLWVRETWQVLSFDYDWETGHCDDSSECDPEMVHQWLTKNNARQVVRPPCGVVYSADDWWELHKDDRGFRWRSPLFMPRWASRITLEITGICVERVQDISEEDAVAEGIDARPQRARDWYGNLWDSINAKRGFSWDANPYVWVVEFRRGE